MGFELGQTAQLAAHFAQGVLVKGFEMLAPEPRLEEGRGGLEPRGGVNQVLRYEAGERTREKSDGVRAHEVAIVPGAGRAGDPKGGTRRAQRRAQAVERPGRLVEETHEGG